MTTPATAPEKRLYKSSYPNQNVILPKGKVLAFRGGIYITGDSEEIAYLDEQIAHNGFSGNVYIDPNARTITQEQENPMLALKKKFFQEFQAEQAAFVNPANDMGSSEQGRLNPASTTDIAPVAIGGDGASGLRAAVASRSK